MISDWLNKTYVIFYELDDDVLREEQIEKRLSGFKLLYYLVPHGGNAVEKFTPIRETLRAGIRQYYPSYNVEPDG